MKRITRKKAIRLKCLDCCAGQQKEVKLCPAEDCPLYRFRMGRESLATILEKKDRLENIHF